MLTPRHLFNLQHNGILKLGVTEHIRDVKYLAMIKAGNGMKMFKASSSF